MKWKQKENTESEIDIPTKQEENNANFLFLSYHSLILLQIVRYDGVDELALVSSQNSNKTSMNNLKQA